MKAKLAKIFAIRNPKRTANIVFGILDMLTILLYLRLFRILPTSIFSPYEIPLVSRFLFTLEFLLLVSFGVSGILYFLDKPAAYFMYPPQFVGRLTFALFSFGFLFKIRIIFNAQGVYSVVFGVCVVLEIFRLVGTIFMFRQMYRNRKTGALEEAAKCPSSPQKSPRSRRFPLKFPQKYGIMAKEQHKEVKHMVNDEIREMTRRFVEALHPAKIILFGSYAKDTYRDDSDYDFYIIMPDDTDKNMIDATAEAYLSLWDMHDRKPVDILMNKQSHFDYRKDALTMEKIVEREGIVLYG